MQEPNGIVIQTKGLTKSFGQVQALDSLDLTVPKNSIFGFLGPNGAGKTTTMKLLLGLARPTHGRGTIFGQDIVTDSLSIRSRIGYMPQQPRFIPEMSARETLRFTARFFFTGPKAGIEGRIDEVLEMVGLQDKANRAVKGFSRGERQRLGLAQAQINEPDLLILDEPAAALDPIGRRDVLQIMDRLREHTTIFYSTHILDDVQHVSDTVAILNRGKLVAQGPIERLLNSNGKTIYTITLKGVPGACYHRLTCQPWISAVDEIRRNGTITWQVGVTDETVAERELFRLLAAEEELIVTGYQRKEYQLEEVFMNLVQGENDARQ